MLARATGALDAATALVVDTHAALCPSCHAELRVLDAAGGALFADIAPVAMSPGAFEALMKRIDTEAEPQAQVDTDGVSHLPEPLRAIVTRALAAGRWRTLAPGIRGLDLPVGPPAHAGAVQLMRLEPGRGVPRHGHAGHELTLVLEGAFRDEAGRYEAGDFILCGPSDTHRPVAEPGRVCLALAVTDAPLKLAGVLGLIQRAFLQTRA
jgi:putative transcriptional regulator